MLKRKLLFIKNRDYFNTEYFVLISSVLKVEVAIVNIIKIP